MLLWPPTPTSPHSPRAGLGMGWGGWGGGHSKKTPPSAKHLALTPGGWGGHSLSSTLLGGHFRLLARHPPPHGKGGGIPRLTSNAMC